MSITFQQIRRQLYSEAPGSGLVFTAATVPAAGTSGITTIDPRIVEGAANANTNKYVGKYILRPTLAAADQIRAAATRSVTSGTATLLWTGATNYADTTTQ